MLASAFVAYCVELAANHLGDPLHHRVSFLWSEQQHEILDDRFLVVDPRRELGRYRSHVAGILPTTIARATFLPSRSPSRTLRAAAPHGVIRAGRRSRGTA